MNAENIKTLYYAASEINGEPETFTERTDSLEALLIDSLKQINDSELRFKIDSIIGALMLNSEYKGFELGMTSHISPVGV